MSKVKPNADTLPKHDDVAPNASVEFVVPLFAESIEAIQKASVELALDSEEQAMAISGLVAVAKRRLPQVMTMLFLEALVPLVQKRAFIYFRHDRNESIEDAMDLSQMLVTKILQELVGHWPHGNIGAWVATIRAHLYSDHVYERDRERQWLKEIEIRWNAMSR